MFTECHSVDRGSLGPARLLAAWVLLLGGCAGNDEGGVGMDPGDACPPDWSLCGDVCADLQGDGAHCGQCGRRCATGEICSAGSCVGLCGDGQSLCGASCVDLRVDSAHCGACGVACAVGQRCTNGTCVCLAGRALCGDACVDLSSDGAHCGGCGVACVGQVCADGTCQQSCPPALTACGSSCVDLATDLLNCGACGAACGAGQLCIAGSCGCPAGLTACGGSCVDLQGDGANCGACGQRCGVGQACSEGRCVTSCPLPGQTACGTSCVDLASDPAHCGACGAACSGNETCHDGTCEPTNAGTGGVGTGGAGSGGTITGGATSGGAGTGGTTSGGTGGDSDGGGVLIGETCFPLCASASSDPEGDGWGWENDASCVVEGSSPYRQGTPCSAGTGGATSGGAGTGGAGTGGTSGGGTGGATGCAATGFHVSDGRLEDVTCRPFVMRGVNYPYAWFTTRNTQQDFQAIASTGANAVRIVLATGGRWTRVSGSTLSSLIGWARSSRLVAVVEVHDTTGWSEQSGSVELTNATSYWTSQDIRSALNGQEAYVIVNVGNEPMGNNTTNDWATRHATAVATLRNAGLRHTLMVDAPNWGQDWTNTMRDGSGTDSIWSADPDRNLVFSIHMYDVYGSSATVTGYFNGFLDRTPALPLVVGEFAADHGAAGDVDEDTIMQLSQTLGVGYLGWSWSGNSGDLASLDITNNFAVNSLTTWGNRLVNGSNGIASTAEACGCFD